MASATAINSISSSPRRRPLAGLNERVTGSFQCNVGKENGPLTTFNKSFTGAGKWSVDPWVEVRRLKLDERLGRGLTKDFKAFQLENVGPEIGDVKLKKKLGSHVGIGPVKICQSERSSWWQSAGGTKLFYEGDETQRVSPFGR